MSCDSCKHYSALKEPRIQKDKDNFEYTIFGYCFRKRAQFDYNKGMAVFISEGTCKLYEPLSRKHKKQNVVGEMSILDLMEVTE